MAIQRARSIENNVFALAHEKPEGNIGADTGEIHSAVTLAQSWLQDANNIALLTLYETRLRRGIEKDKKELAQLQTERKAARATALEEALLLAQLARMKKEIYDPAIDFPPGAGFEFSAEEINTILSRSHRVREAQFSQKNAWNRKAQFAKAA